jgi:hypothetical protein
MCMMCEEEAMYQMYLAHLARKSQSGAALTPEEQSFLQDSGFQAQASSGFQATGFEASGAQASGFSCDPAPANDEVYVVGAPTPKAS